MARSKRRTPASRSRAPKKQNATAAQPAGDASVPLDPATAQPDFQRIIQLWGGDVIRLRQFRVRPSFSSHDFVFLSSLLHDGFIRSISQNGGRVSIGLTRDTWENVHAGAMDSFESELQLSRVIDISTTAGSLERLLKRPELMILHTLLEYKERPNMWNWRLSFHGRDARNRRWNLTFTLRNEYDVLLTDLRRVEYC